MSTSSGENRPHARRRAVVVGVAVVAALLLVWALVRGAGGADTEPVALDPTPSAEQTPSEDATPSGPDATEPSDPAPEPAPPVADPGLDAEQPALPEPLTPRSLTEDVPLGEEAVARVALLEAVEGAPQGVGEVAGPALRLTIELENTGDEPIPLDAAVVNVTHGPQDVPATELSGPGRDPFGGELAPGERATGVYVFLVPVDARDQVSVSLEYRFGAPIAVFEGSASAAPAG